MDPKIAATGVKEAQATQSRKMEDLGRLTSGIAHEINTPMQYLGDNTTFLKSVYQDLFGLLHRYRQVVDIVKSGSMPESTVLGDLELEEKRVEPEYLESEILKTIEQSLEGIDRVVTITMALKEFARPVRYGATPSDINRGIRSTVTLARREWKYVAELELDLDENLPRVHCQLDEMNQVVLNILVNGAQAIREKIDLGLYEQGKIVIRTRSQGNEAVLTISDDGAGIPEDVKAHIFEPFFTTKDPGKGTGQGLAIVWEIIARKHGGRIEVESKPGQGSTFIIRLPIQPVVPAMTPTGANP